MSRRVHVSVDVGGATLLAGVAHFDVRRATLSTTYQYDDLYRADGRAYPLDPVLPLYRGAVHAGRLPGSFQDCAPDRWGRNLLRKRSDAAARLEGRVPHTLSDADYLLGVSDLSRQGALRFSDEVGGPYLADDHDVPKVVELPRLLHASDQVAADEPNLDAVKELLDAGSGSLGGARPKASVRDRGRLLLAKFPHPGDTWNVMAWEKTALDLAERAGIATPSRRLVTVGGRSVLLLDRFDRADSGHRVGYISAMSLLEARDGESRDYVEIAEALAEHGSDVRKDLAELWRRAAFFLAMNNTDDHLRNHGFLATPGGWTLSPCFDVNPNPSGADRRVTAIGGAYGRADGLKALGLYRDTFGLTEHEARDVLAEVAAATSTWREVAASNGVSAREIDMFAPVFDEGAAWSAG